MKKGFTIAIALLGTVAANAQAPQALSVASNANAKVMVKNTLPERLQVFGMAEQGAKGKSIVRHSAATNNYYSRPAGAFYRGFNTDGSGLIFSALEGPLGQPITFTASNANATWKQGGRTLPNAGSSYSFELPYGGAMSYAPVSVVSTDSFAIGMNSLYTRLYDTNNASVVNTFNSYGWGPITHWGLVVNDSIAPLYAADDHAALVQAGRVYTNVAGFGYLSNFSMFGTGSVNVSGTDYTNQGVYQIYGTPSAPLYVESIVANGKVAVNYNNNVVQANGKPLNNGATLTAYVVGTQLEDVQTSDGQTVQVKRPNFDDVIATLTATEGDTLGFVEQNSVNISDGTNSYPYTYSQGSLLFSNKVEDEFGGSIPEPFIIPAGKEFAVVITGFANPGVQFSVDGLEVPDEDADSVENGYNILTDANGNTRELTFSSAIAANIGIVGMYDGALAPAHPGLYSFENADYQYNVVRISNDGQTNLTDGATASIEDANGDGLPGAMVTTTIPFFAADGSENYRLIDQPDWVSSVNIIQLDQDANIYVAQFVANALPAGTSKRAAAVRIASDKGAISGPIYLLQGDATLQDGKDADGISSVSVENVKTAKDNRIFNLAGQQVDKAYKGIVISNGKKYIQK